MGERERKEEKDRRTTFESKTFASLLRSCVMWSPAKKKMGAKRDGGVRRKRKMAKMKRGRREKG